MSISNPPFQSTLVDADGRTQTPWVQWFSQLQPLLNSVNSSGPTSARPTSGLYIGYAYFDTTIDQMIYWNGATWVVNAPSTSGTSILKGNGTGGFNNAISGIDFAPATTGAAILFGNAAGGFNSVAIGSGVTFVGGVLSATGTGGTVTSVTGISPILSSGGNTPAISIPVATTLVSGYLSTFDWNTFNNKQPAGAYLTASTGVTTFAGNSTGLTPATATTGAITLAGTLVASNGGTGVAGTLTGISYMNGVSAHTVATTAQALSLIGTLPVANGGTGVTSSTGAGAVVLSASPTFTGRVGFANIDTTTIVADGMGVRIRRSATGAAILQFTNNAASTQLASVSHDGSNLIIASSVGNTIVGTLQFADGSTQISHAVPQVTIYTSGSGTYTTPTNAKFLHIKMVGGGAGGAGGGISTVQAGGAGGNTTFGTSLLAANGAGGTSTSSLGGSATVTSPAVGIACTGSLGQGFTAFLAQYGTGGIGGTSQFGGNGSGYANGAGTAAAANSGSGGAGGGTSNVGSLMYTGAGGGAGGYIDAIINSPSATYAYSIGAGGTAGAAGTSAFAGGAGGSGTIYITAYF